MKLLPIITGLLFISSCKCPCDKSIDSVVEVSQKIEAKKVDYDSLGLSIDIAKLKPVKATLEVNDTVLVSVINHGNSIGIITAKDGDDFYVSFFSCNCNGWYERRFHNIKPFSMTWDVKLK